MHQWISKWIFQLQNLLEILRGKPLRILRVVRDWAFIRLKFFCKFHPKEKTKKKSYFAKRTLWNVNSYLGLFIRGMQIIFYPSPVKVEVRFNWSWCNSFRENSYAPSKLVFQNSNYRFRKLIALENSYCWMNSGPIRPSMGQLT